MNKSCDIFTRLGSQWIGVEIRWICILMRCSLGSPCCHTMAQNRFFNHIFDLSLHSQFAHQTQLSIFLIKISCRSLVGAHTRLDARLKISRRLEVEKCSSAKHPVAKLSSVKARVSCWLLTNSFFHQRRKIVDCVVLHVLGSLRTPSSAGSWTQMECVRQLFF